MHTSLCALLLFCTYVAFGQKTEPIPSYWSAIESDNKNGQADISHRYFQLDHTHFYKLLAQVPMEGIAKNKQSKTVLSFPTSNGSFQTFLIEEISNFHPDLAARFPMIKSYKGRNVDQPTNTIRFSIAPQGISAMIQSVDKPTVFIDKSNNTTNELYQVYHKENKVVMPYACEVHEIANRINPNSSNARNQKADCQLRTFRLALACTGEYAQYHGGNTIDVLAAMNATLTIINGIFERDLAIHLELIPETTNLIHLDATTDPYSNLELTNMLGENQIECDTKIGAENYDIGHVFGTALGGVAFLGVVCQNGFKASGATGFVRPEGPTFAIDLVAHEIGHQFGAQHTFNGDQVACSGSNRSSETSVEPGSGSTIMSYAGICPPQDVQNNSDAYFHAISLQQIREVLNSNGDCAAITPNFNNSSPLAEPLSNIFYIPQSTPFVLEITADDTENNTLTYTWEQMDKEIAPQPPLSTNAGGPLFRSLPPTESPTRYFPNLNDLVNNSTPRWEVLPSVARTMNFRGTVRDNFVGGGCTDEFDIQIEVADVVPFEVLSPNDNVTWEAGTQKTVTWVVGQTNSEPINTQSIDILLSVDGGFTYPTVLAKNVPNKGISTILVPNVVTNTARIMVRASENIFFDISNENFEITKPTNDFEVTVVPNLQVCVPNAAVFDIQIGETGSFEEQIDLSVEGLPIGVTSVFSNETTVAPSSVSLSLSNFNGISGGIELTLIAASGDNEKTRTLSVFVSNNLPSQPNLLRPIDNAGNVILKPILEWIPIAETTTYQLELSTNPDFKNEKVINYLLENNTFEIPSNLNNATKYYWRVRGENACGVGVYSNVFTFETANEICGTFGAIDLPKDIPSLFRSTVVSEIEITDKGKLLDLNVKNLSITHSFIGDLNIELESPSGTVIRLVQTICNASKDLGLNFDDDGSNTYDEIPCPPISAEFFQPLDDFLTVAGEEINGIWLIRVIDTELLDGGDFKNWEMEICYQKEKSLTLFSNKKAVSCFGEQDGILSVVPEGGTGNYQYTWSTGDTTATVTGLSAGAYMVTIFDGQNSMDTTLIIEQPSTLNIKTNIVQDGCVGEDNGQLTTQISGGVGPYNLEWSNGAVTADLDNLNTGNYTLTLTDELGCTQIASQAITVFPLVEFSVNILENPSCPLDSTGRISLDLPSENVTISWTNGLFDSNLDEIKIGSYRIAVIDENGCSGIEDFEIKRELDTIKPLLNLANPVLYLDEDGLANLDVSDFDKGSFDNCGEINLQASLTAYDCQNIGSQSLFVEGTDESGNSSLEELTIDIRDTLPPVFECLEEIFIIGCRALTENDYPKAIDNCGNVNISLLQSSDGGFSSNPNILSFRAIDKNGNESYCYTFLRRDNDLSANLVSSEPFCTGENNGSATVTTVGGQAPYTYQWNDENKQTTATAIQLFSGAYEVTITDNSGCQITEKITLGTPFPIGLFETTIQAEVNGRSNGSIMINPLGGTGELAILWFKNDSLIGNDLMIENLTAGDYEVQISDANNCQFTRQFTVGLLTNTNNFSFIEHINLYPNPTSGLIALNVHLTVPKPYIISVHNLLGAEIIPPIYRNSPKESYEIDLSAFENGLYFLKLNFEEGVLTKYIVVSR